MKKLILTVSILTSALLSAQTYPYSESFDSMPTGSAPTGTWYTPANGFQVLANHGTANTNGCSSEMKSTHNRDTLITPILGPTTSTTIFNLNYRIVDASLYPAIGTTLGTGDTITIDAYAFGMWNNGVGQIFASSHTTANTFTSYTYTPGIGGITAKLRIDVARSNGDWWIDIDDVYAKDAGSTFGISYNASNPPALLALPNPSNGSFVVWIKNYTGKGEVNLKLYNHMGQLVKTITQGNILNNQFNVNTTDLAKGVYMVEVISGNEVSKTKVIVE